MQNLQDIQEKIFFEAKSILDTLYKINTIDELLAKQNLFAEVTDRIAFLRILEKNEDNFSPILIDNIKKYESVHDNQIIDEATEHVEFNESALADDIMEEEVAFTNELNDFHDEIVTEPKIEIQPNQIEDFEDSNINVEVDLISESDFSDDYEIPLIVEQEEPDYAERVAKKERDFEEMEDRRRTIVEFTKHEHSPEETVEINDNTSETAQQQAEKKFKLANIKGLKVMQHLFDNDIIEEDKVIEESPAALGSLLKSNVQTDFMQAEKKKTEFRLDLNDKVAFTKSLFAGNDQELKETIEKLNSFDKLEEAKQYLSEIYYKKDWSKVDEYAQRLWNLVENKFM